MEQTPKDGTIFNITTDHEKARHVLIYDYSPTPQKEETLIGNAQAIFLSHNNHKNTSYLVKVFMPNIERIPDKILVKVFEEQITAVRYCEMLHTHLPHELGETKKVLEFKAKFVVKEAESNCFDSPLHHLFEDVELSIIEILTEREDETTDD